MAAPPDPPDLRGGARALSASLRRTLARSARFLALTLAQRLEHKLTYRGGSFPYDLCVALDVCNRAVHDGSRAIYACNYGLTRYELINGHERECGPEHYPHGTLRVDLEGRPLACVVTAGGSAEGKRPPPSGGAKS